MKKCLMIYNPESGKGFGEDNAKSYVAMLEENGYQVTEVATHCSGDATEIIKNAPFYDVVFAIGGDGTINEVVNGNSKRNKKLVICPLPGGTCNDFSSMMGYGRNLSNNLKMALNGEIKSLDVGSINKHYFIYVAGIGKFLNISYETPREEKKKFGYIAYIWNGFKQAFKPMKMYHAKVCVDGENFEDDYCVLMISNSNHIAGVKKFYKNVCLNDDVMEVLLIKSKNIFSLAFHFLAFLMGFKTSKIVQIKGEDIKIDFVDEEMATWGVDGEECPCQENKFHIEVDHDMKFLVPKKNLAKLFK